MNPSRLISLGATLLFANATLTAPGQSQELTLFLPPAQIGIPLSVDVTEIPVRDAASRGLESGIQFEADIFFPLTLRRAFGWSELLGGNDSGFNFYFTPRMRLRGLEDFSSPLKSSSFMPRFDAQYIHSKFNPPRPGRVEGTRRVLGVTLSHGHHSNGGPDCLLIEEGPIQDPVDPTKQLCQAPAGLDLSGMTVNPAGSFSTNFFRLKGSIGWIKFDTGPQRITWLGTVSLFGEMNPEGLRFIHLFGGATTENQRAIHGANRWGVRVEGETPTIGPGRFGANIDFVRISGRGQGDLLGTYHADWSNKIWMIEGYYRLEEWVRGWGLALRYYRGQDYHNLDFVKDVARVGTCQRQWDTDGD